jgi:hypothetical protein
LPLNNFPHQFVFSRTATIFMQQTGGFMVEKAPVIDQISKGE